jgi:hypothetical protein
MRPIDGRPASQADSTWMTRVNKTPSPQDGLVYVRSSHVEAAEGGPSIGLVDRFSQLSTQDFH